MTDLKSAYEQACALLQEVGDNLIRADAYLTASGAIETNNGRRGNSADRAASIVKFQKFLAERRLRD